MEAIHFFHAGVGLNLSIIKMLVANVLVWIPALPLLFVAGLAFLFILFGQ